jgi:hypothetical protein
MSSDIYESRESVSRGSRRGSAISQRRDEYLRATGGEVVPHHRHHHKGRRYRSVGWKAVLLGFGVLVLLAAGAFWWLMNKR